MTEWGDALAVWYALLAVAVAAVGGWYRLVYQREKRERAARQDQALVGRGKDRPRPEV